MNQLLLILTISLFVGLVAILLVFNRIKIKLKKEIKLVREYFLCLDGQLDRLRNLSMEDRKKLTNNSELIQEYIKARKEQDIRLDAELKGRIKNIALKEKELFTTINTFKDNIRNKTEAIYNRVFSIDEDVNKLKEKEKRHSEALHLYMSQGYSNERHGVKGQVDILKVSLGSMQAQIDSLINLFNRPQKYYVGDYGKFKILSASVQYNTNTDEYDWAYHVKTRSINKVIFQSDKYFKNK